jgi:pimeloyl-ACP methyl ester carboxylesterase
MLDALGLPRAPIVGTSLGAMWALCFALEVPERVSAVIGLGMPAAALPGLRGNPFFKIVTTPGLGRLVSHAPAPSSAMVVRKATAKVLGKRALARTPDAFFEVVRTGMARPGWGMAMWTHLNLAMRVGRPRPGNALSNDELGAISAPVQLIWGDGDVYGGPEIGRHAVDAMPDARLEIIRGGHAPFLDDPELCAELIRKAT